MLRSYLAALLLVAGAFQPSLAQAIPVAVSYAPDNDLALTVSSIRMARESLFINIYDLSSPDVANAILDRIQAGIHVEILEEGTPVGGMSTAAKGIASQLAQAMNQSCGDRFSEMSAKNGKRRFRWDHAKYVVIDRVAVLVGSENYSPTGNPSPGALGNRGWEVLVQDPSLASQFLAMFQSDSDPSNADINVLTQSRAGRCTSRTAQPSVSGVSSGGVFNAASAKMIVSPTTSQNGLIDLINSARQSIVVQQMEFDSMWGTAQSPLVAALAQAQRRGVNVRVLVNDDSVFAHGGNFHSKNTDTINALEQLGVQAAMADVKAMGVDYIHNKGAIVDGHLTLISSINWNQNSITQNRESALIIDSPEVAQYYDAIFEKDWQVSASRGSRAGTPIGHVHPHMTVQPEVAGAPQVDHVHSFSCPKAVDIRLQIGQLKIDDSHDIAFEALSGEVFAQHFERDTSHDCLFVSSPSTLSIADKRYLELREQDGTLAFILEGYLGAAYQQYSIRAYTSATSSAGSAKATVYEGAGTRSPLGTAALSFQWAP